MDIYGLGNALVDTEVSVTDEELKELGIEKGLMTLVEAPRMLELLSHFGHRIHDRASGGSAANTIIGATQLGATCFYSCRVSDDDTGRFFRDDLIGNGVSSNVSQGLVQSGNTGTCLVLVSPDAERSMLTYLGVTAELDNTALDATVLSQSKVLYIEGYLAASPTALEAAEKAKALARAHDVAIACTLSDPSMVSFCKDGLDSIISGDITLLFCNESEALAYTGASDVDTAIKMLHDYSEIVTVTLGAKGAVVSRKSEVMNLVPTTTDVTAVDSNGAGDAYAGAFLAKWLEGEGLIACARAGNDLAGQVVSQFGPRLSA